MSFTKETSGLSNRSGWPAGPWDDEADAIEWEDNATGLACFILRHPSLGHLCGYVGLPEGHPWYGQDCDAIEPSPDVHGGLTASDSRKFLTKEDLAPSAEGLWWIGFDCAHICDLVPAMPGTAGLTDTYRGVDFVKAQCASLARQAEAVAS